ncbi:hypothetical protein FISHEDRAFT_61027 [Fistulina hepatica ATCC 64428]|uniref:Uncharacterized protein n=1 Tax=Fistulina hepatica ATCC 64428 TaxID=1128425 RepID=A0A0D7A6T5_9AGAR|nr:hypothetical protein FISHEDRAFT_61027 [Fistulina hepatica ATCC 64428]
MCDLRVVAAGDSGKYRDGNGLTTSNVPDDLTCSYGVVILTDILDMKTRIESSSAVHESRLVVQENRFTALARLEFLILVKADTFTFSSSAQRVSASEVLRECCFRSRNSFSIAFASWYFYSPELQPIGSHPVNLESMLRVLRLRAKGVRVHPGIVEEVD